MIKMTIEQEEETWEENTSLYQWITLMEKTIQVSSKKISNTAGVFITACRV
jgi:hypothetical protein